MTTERLSIFAWMAANGGLKAFVFCREFIFSNLRSEIFNDAASGFEQLKVVNDSLLSWFYPTGEPTSRS